MRASRHSKTARARVSFSFSVSVSVSVSVVALLWIACDDAVLGVRSLPCDGGACEGDAAGPADEGDAPSCPVVTPPECNDGGVATERRDGGCVVGYDCVTPCVSLGGSCSTRDDCQGGRWAEVPGTDCIELALGCCRPCPAVMAPPPGFCDGGGVEVREGDCVVGFTCE